MPKNGKLKKTRKIDDETIFFLSDGIDRGDGMVDSKGGFEDRGREGRSVRGKWGKKGGKVGDFTNFAFSG